MILESLSHAEAQQRLARFGPNLLPRRRQPGLLRLYVRQFGNPLVYLLLAPQGRTRQAVDVVDSKDVYLTLLEPLGATSEEQEGLPRV